MTHPLPTVTAYLHGGPRDGETATLPWARIDLELLRWEGEEMLGDLYRLRGPWRGQAWAHYDHVPAEEQAA